MANSLPDATGYSGEVTPARAFAIELRSLWVDARECRIGPIDGDLVDVLERLARAADQFAEHTESGVPQIDIEAFARRHAKGF